MTKLTGIVCLDGANATGKTTVAKELERRHGAISMHQTYRFKNRIFDYHTAVLRRALSLAKDNLVVLDRLWMSEAVYAEVYRGGTPWPHQGRFVDRVLMKACAVQVVTVEDDDKALAERLRLTRSHRTDIDIENSLKANAKYREVFSPAGEFSDCFPRNHYLDDLTYQNLTRPDIIRHSISPGSTEATVDKIEKTLAMLKETQFPGALSNDNYLGHFSGRTAWVIVGDKPNAKHRWTWPFYEYRYSSLFLTQCLHHLNFDESLAVWTNANDDSTKTLIELVRHGAKGLNFLALGEEAARALEWCGIEDVVKVPHPSYGQRFMQEGEYYYELHDALQDFLRP